MDIKPTKVYSSIKYLEIGDGQPLIFLHASLYSSEGYPGLLQILGNKFHVYALDMPSHGRSDRRTDDLTIDGMTSLLKHFVEWKKINQPIIIAHSGGSALAIKYAANNPVKELVLIGPAGVPYKVKPIRLLAKWIFQKTYLAYSQNIQAGNMLVKTGLLTIIKNLGNRQMTRLLMEIYHANYIEYMKKVTCPTKLLFAKRDELCSFNRASIFYENINNSTIIEIDGTHDWPIIRPQLIIPHLTKT